LIVDIQGLNLNDVYSMLVVLNVVVEGSSYYSVDYRIDRDHENEDAFHVLA